MGATVPTCVIFNPAAGRGKARQLIQAAVGRLGAGVELRPTDRPGHAIELARTAAEEGFARVVAAGGDGTVHEVANGLLLANRPDVVFSTLPLGSMNDYAFALGLGKWWREPPPGPPLTTRNVDVGVIRAAGRERFFVNGIGVGFNGMVTIESRSIRRVRGLTLYTVAFLKAGWKHFRQPVLSVTLDGVEVCLPTLAVSVSLGPREGGFPVAPRAVLEDGLFDVFHAAGLKRWHLLRYLPALLTGRLPSNHPNLRTGRNQRVAIRSEEPLCVHTDGELFCVPGDGVMAVEVELLPGRLAVEVCPSHRPGS